MGGCSALNCTNHSSKGHRMVRFPRNEERRNQWIGNTGRIDWEPGPQAQLCIDHFDDSQFEKLCVERRKKLRQDAIPTLFDVPNKSASLMPKRLEGLGYPEQNSILGENICEKVCEVHFKESDFETEISAYDPKTGVTITAPLTHKRLKKGVVPTLLLPSFDSVKPDEKSSSQQKEQLKVGSIAIQNKLKWVPAKNLKLTTTSLKTTSPDIRFPENKVEENLTEMVKRKRKTATDEAVSNKKLESLPKSNGTHFSSAIYTYNKSDNGNNKKFDKPVCTNPEAFAYLNVEIKREPLSDEEMPSNTSRNNPVENVSSVSENVQITNVRSLSSGRSNADSPSEEENSVKKQNEYFDTDFYTKPLDMDQRDKAFGGFVACELSDLHVNPMLYMKTKQSILKILTEAHFEQMSSCKKS